MLGEGVGDPVGGDGPDPSASVLEAPQQDHLVVDLQLYPELVPGHVLLARQGPPGRISVVTNGPLPPCIDWGAFPG